MAAASLNLSDRDRAMGSLDAEPFDLLVIGGGITGAGIARDAALRGLRVALVEARDFASGTSSRSTKLVHGGLRYLAQGDIGLVREAARERTILQGIAPHLAQRALLVLPARTRLDLAVLSAGLYAFERLGNVWRADHFEVWDAPRLRREEPALKTEGLAGAIVYPEYVTDDARLVIANMRSAAEAGAVVVNYAAAEEFLIESGRLAGAVVHETLPASSRNARIKAKLVVNAAGPWVDAVRRIEEPGAPNKLTLTQGIHLVFRRERLPISRMVLASASDGRGVFVVPRDEFVYVGTTDTFRPQTDYWPAISQADIGYLLTTINRSFDLAQLGASDIVAMWSGLRPLVAQPGKGPSEISRKDEIFEGSRGLITIAGGKLTAYRMMAEKTVDLVLKRLGRAAIKSTTAEAPLPGGAEAGIAPLVAGGVSQLDAERLMRLYGSEAEAIATGGGGAAAEARHAVLNEGAVTLEDYWFRRSARAWFPVGEDARAMERASEVMAPLLGWSEAETARQILDCRRRSEISPGASG